MIRRIPDPNAGSRRLAALPVGGLRPKRLPNTPVKGKPGENPNGFLRTTGLLSVVVVVVVVFGKVS